MAFGKKKERNTPEHWLALLPPKIRQEIEELGSKIDDASFSREDFIERSIELEQRVKSMPRAIQNAFEQAVKALAAKERTERRAAGEEVPDAPTKEDLEAIRDGKKI